MPLASLEQIKRRVKRRKFPPLQTLGESNDRGGFGRKDLAEKIHLDGANVRIGGS
jgi:hypothetical protein